MQFIKIKIFGQCGRVLKTALTQRYRKFNSLWDLQLVAMIMNIKGCAIIIADFMTPPTSCESNIYGRQSLAQRRTPGKAAIALLYCR